jgi:hypothetical protein
MYKINDRFQRALKWAALGLPLAGVIAASFLPLRTVYQQALIGVVLIWFQLSLMLGLIPEG